ncbi:iron-sulfur cluster assembly accessory protein [Beggiatoa alba]|nr:iron-sulfur cluster assembly accessory protein [Beggiatoa alba]
MAVILSKSAAEHIQAMLLQRGHGLGLRLATRHAGCSGFTYVVDYVENKSDDDKVFESYGVKVFIHCQDLPELDGTEIDFEKTGEINKGFTFHNPNAKDLCGCGESFSV